MSTLDRRSPLSSAQLRADFDAVFARAHAPESPPQLDLLVIGVGDHGYALALSQVAALHADRRLTEAPSPRRDLLGLVGLRGVVAPVYDLHQLLGYPPLGSPRWLALVQAPAPFAVAFERFERHVRLPAADVAQAQAEASRSLAYAQSSVRTESGLVPLLDLLAIFDDVTHGRRAESAPEPGEERP